MQYRIRNKIKDVVTAKITTTIHTAELSAIMRNRLIEAIKTRTDPNYLYNSKTSSLLRKMQIESLIRDPPAFKHQRLTKEQRTQVGALAEISGLSYSPAGYVWGPSGFLQQHSKYVYALQRRLAGPKILTPKQVAHLHLCQISLENKLPIVLDFPCS